MQQIHQPNPEASVERDMRRTRIVRDEQENEIDFGQYLEIAIKRKKMVLAVFSSAVLISVVWSLLMPKIYEVSVVLGPPVLSITDSGTQELDSVVNIKAKIESGAFNAALINSLNFPEDFLAFRIFQPREAKLLKISLDLPVKFAELGKKALVQLVESLRLNYAQIIEDKRIRIENQIKLIASQIGRKENEIALKNEQFKILSEKEQQYLEDLKSTKTNSEKLLANRTALLDQKESKDDISSLLYTSTLQQNIVYFTQLQNELSEVKLRKGSLLNEVENLKTAINDDRIGIDNLKLSKDAMYNISVIQEPLVSTRPIGPQKRKIVLTAGILGLILGLFAAILVEYRESSTA
jgi:uncharacterized protein involved in exopolysaccharide biosynthesis